MKILIVSTTPFSKNGITTFIKNIIIGFGSFSQHVDLIVPNKLDDNDFDFLNKNNVNVYIVSRDKNPFFYFFKILKFIKKGNYDVVHVNGNSCTMAVELFAAKLSNVKKRIAHSHNTTCKHKIFSFFLRPIFEFSCNMRFACSKNAGKWLFGKKKFYIIKNGLNLTNYCFEYAVRNNIRKKFNIGNDDIVLGNVGSLNLQKNQKFLINLLKKLREKDQNYKLMLVGNGPNLEYIKELVKDKGLSKDTFLVGSVDNVSDYLMAMDIFLLPSLFEGFPFSVLEAEACGLKCIVSNNVSKEIDICDDIYFLPLKNITEWIKEIEDSKNIYNRKSESDENIKLLNKYGFDVFKISRMIFDLYNKD